MTTLTASRRHAAAVFSIIAISVIAYLPAVDNFFISDDFGLIAALQVLATERFDLAILDMHMPGTDGAMLALSIIATPPVRALASHGVRNLGCTELKTGGSRPSTSSAGKPSSGSVGGSKAGAPAGTALASPCAAFSTVSRSPCSTLPFMNERGAFSTTDARTSPGRTSMRPSATRTG